jgi:hypothetical protein
MTMAVVSMSLRTRGVLYASLAPECTTDIGVAADYREAT